MTQRWSANLAMTKISGRHSATCYRITLGDQEPASPTTLPAPRAARCAELLGEGDVCKVLQWLEEEAVLRVPPSGSTGVRVTGAEEG